MDNTDSLSDAMSSPNLRSKERSTKARKDSQRVCGITNSSTILALYPPTKGRSFRARICYKKELIIFGLLALVAVLLLYQFAWPKQQITVEKPAAIPEQLPVMPEILPQITPTPEVPAPQPTPTVPEMQPIPEAMPQVPSETTEEESGLIFGEGLSAAAQQPTPTKENLIPAYMEFQVNKLMIPEYFGYEFIPIKKDNIRTFAGKFGPYYYDYRPYIYAELCSFISSQPEMFACEKVSLNYINNYLTFVNGYKPDEFIGNVAMKNFGAYYLVRSKEHGLLAKSNVAPIKIVNN